MNEILVNQINGDTVDLSVYTKFKEHHIKNNSYSDYIITKEINTGLYDEPLFNGMFNNNPTVIDAGANVGLFTIYVLPMVKHVYCIEPTLSHFEVLRDLFGDSNNVEIHNIALNNYDGKCNFKITENNTTENKISSIDTGLSVKCLTLKSFFEENSIKEIDLLKMDIEGGEDAVLMKDPTVDAALNMCNMVYIETHPAPWGPIKERDLIRKMVGLGFKHQSGKRKYAHYFFK